MRALLRVLLPCAGIALAAACGGTGMAAPSQRIAVAASLSAAHPSSGPGDCAEDSKLLNGGPTAVYGEGAGTWWGLVLNGLNLAGFTSDGLKIAYLNHLFATSFTSLAQLEVYNQDLVSGAWDKNQNGYVCAFELRGTRAYLGDPLVNQTFFGISDDKLGK